MNLLIIDVGLAQLCVGGTLANLVGRLWALRISIFVMCIGVVAQSVPNTFGVLLFGRLLTYVDHPFSFSSGTDCSWFDLTRLTAVSASDVSISLQVYMVG